MEYPNLELVAYKAKLMLQNDPGFKERFAETTKDSKFKMRPDCEIICFPQTWATTALGFDAPGTMCGQAFTKAYTTVIHECVTDTYLVFLEEDQLIKSLMRLMLSTETYLTGI